jgi:hypothetical protein
MGRILAIVVVVLILAFGAYKIFSSSVDHTDADAVGKAFLQHLEKEQLGKASKYVLPEQAEAWEADARSKLSNMRTNAMTIFREAIPDEPTFVTVPAPKGSTDVAKKAGETVITMRQVDGKWYVTSCSQP